MRTNRARRASGRRSPLLGPVSGLAVAVAVLSACSGSPEPAASPTPSPTPIEQLNAAALDVPRIEFCGQVPDRAVTDALGGEPADAAAYGNGDTEPASGVEDVLHELGCAWTADDGGTARAWVFAQPATAALAQQVTATDARVQGCRVVDGPEFGAPATTQQCTFADGRSRVRHAGLFGQTWLSCEVGGPARQPVAEVTARADAWCVEVAEALSSAG